MYLPKKTPVKKYKGCSCNVTRIYNIGDLLRNRRKNKYKVMVRDMLFNATFIRWRNSEYSEKNTDLLQDTDKLYH